MLFGTLAVALGLMAGGVEKASVLDAEDFRIYCGFLAESAKDEYQRMTHAQRYASVSKLAKVSPRQLEKIVARGRATGDSCESVARLFEESARKALAATPLNERVLSLSLDVDDPTHVVAYVCWKADQEKRLEEEAAWVAWAVRAGAPIVRTLSTRAVDPKDGETARFEGKISAEQMSKIQKDRIDSFADARYLKLFDGVLFSNPGAHPTAPR
jgi:hypothetical protein